MEQVREESARNSAAVNAMENKKTTKPKETKREKKADAEREDSIKMDMSKEDLRELLEKLRPDLGNYIISHLDDKTVEETVIDELKNMSAQHKKMSFEDRVIGVQTEVAVGKDKYNDFGHYSYRDLESIFTPLKRALKKYRLMVEFDDHIVVMDNRRYVESVASLTDGEKKISARGLAREPDAKKGMDESQVTGGALTYARKYAVQALLLISEPDPDSMRPESSYSDSAQEGSNIAMKIKVYLDAHGDEAKKYFANGHKTVKEMNYEERKATLETLEHVYGK